MSAVKGPTVIQVAVSNGGPRKAMQALNWILDFGVTDAMGDLADTQNLTEAVVRVGEMRGYSPAKAWRNQRAFRKCLPMFEQPMELVMLPGNRELRTFLRSMADLGHALDGASLGKAWSSVSAAAVA